MKATEKLVIGALVFGVALPVATVTASGYALPQPKTENGITYVTGGIGEDEAKAMKEEAKHYPLSMVFSAHRNNEYLADVQVTIKDKAGTEVLNAISDGPIILLKLPAGRYTIEAEVGGETLRRMVHVRADGEQQIAFHWPSV